MDFRQSNQAPAARAEQASAAPAATSHATVPEKKIIGDTTLPKWLNILNMVALLGITALLALIAISFARFSGGANETQYVDSTKYQAVFLNNGQVYFGKVSDLNSKYLTLGKIYYLTQNTTAAANGQTQASSDYTLVKLGCQQIHYPTDQMVINRDQVTFWENLNKDGKVAKSIEEFVKQNPNGPDCTKVSDQTQPTSNPSAQGSTTPSNTTTTKKP